MASWLGHADAETVHGVAGTVAVEWALAEVLPEGALEVGLVAPQHLLREGF